MAGGAVALGLDGLGGKHRRRAVAGLLIGLSAVVVCLGASDWTSG